MKNSCEVCGNQNHRNEKHDAYYCDPCDEWKEKTCRDDMCLECTTRPARPSMVVEETKDENEDEDLKILRYVVYDTDSDNYRHINPGFWTENLPDATLYETAKGARVAEARHRKSRPNIAVHEVSMVLEKIEMLAT